MYCVKRGLGKVKVIECIAGKASITEHDELFLHIGRGMCFESVETLCCLREMLTFYGGFDCAVLTRVSKTWSKFRELKPFFACQEDWAECKR